MKTAITIIVALTIALWVRALTAQEADITPPDSGIVDPLDMGGIPIALEPVQLTVTVQDYAFLNTNIYCVLGGSFNGVNWIKLDSEPSAPVVTFQVISDDQYLLFRAGNQIGP